MTALDAKQVHALAATVGLLEARIDIERITGVAALPELSQTAAQLCYSAIATAFPELSYLIDAQYLNGRRLERAAEPCS